MAFGVRLGPMSELFVGYSIADFDLVELKRRLVALEAHAVRVEAKLVRLEGLLAMLMQTPDDITLS